MEEASQEICSEMRPLNPAYVSGRADDPAELPKGTFAEPFPESFRGRATADLWKKSLRIYQRVFSKTENQF